MHTCYTMVVRLTCTVLFRICSPGAGAYEFSGKITSRMSERVRGNMLQASTAKMASHGQNEPSSPSYATSLKNLPVNSYITLVSKRPQRHSRIYQ